MSISLPLVCFRYKGSLTSAEKASNEAEIRVAKAASRIGQRDLKIQCEKDNLSASYFRKYKMENYIKLLINKMSQGLEYFVSS